MTTYRDYLNEEPVRSKRIRVTRHSQGRLATDLDERLAEIARNQPVKKEKPNRGDRTGAYLAWVHGEPSDWEG
jgi:hypothetical protein